MPSCVGISKVQIFQPLLVSFRKLSPDGGVVGLETSSTPPQHIYFLQLKLFHEPLAVYMMTSVGIPFNVCIIINT